MKLSIDTLAMLTSMGDKEARDALNRHYCIRDRCAHVYARNGQIRYSFDDM